MTVGGLGTKAREGRWARGLGARAQVLGAAVFAWACGGAPPKAPESPAPAPAPEPTRAAAPRLFEEEMPDTLVHAAFTTSVEAVAPRAKFLLAVHFDIADGYRISWTNPGDVGRTTEVSFEVPEGFELGEVRFPVPTRFDLPGDLVSYGYQGHTAVFAEVTAPAELAPNRVHRFDAKATWVACKKDCGREELSAYVELVSMRKAPYAELSDDLAQHYAELPQAFEDLPTATHEWKGSVERPLLALSADKVRWIDFLLDDVARWKLVRVESTELGLNLRFAGAGGQRLRGLARVERDGKEGYYDVDLPGPEASAPQARATRRPTK